VHLALGVWKTFLAEVLFLVFFNEAFHRKTLQV